MSTSGPAGCGALAVTTATRSEALPDIPTVGDFVPGYEASGWYRRRRAQGHAGRDRRQAQQGDQRRPRRSQDEGAACRPGRHVLVGLARRIRQAHRRRNREVGQGDPSGEHQAGVIARYSITARSAKGRSRCDALRMRRIQGDDAMKLPRRTFLHLVAGTAALPIASPVAVLGQGHPDWPHQDSRTHTILRQAWFGCRGPRCTTQGFRRARRDRASSR